MPITLHLSESELLVLGMLAGIGASSFDAPGGPAYVIKGRLEEKHKVVITTDDITNVLTKLDRKLKEGKT